MAHIGLETRRKIANLVHHALQEESLNLERAYLTAGDDPLSISINVKVDPAQKGGNDIDFTMTYTVEKRKYKAKAFADEDQQGLFDAVDDFKKIIPKGDSVTISANDGPGVTIEGEGEPHEDFEDDRFEDER